MKSRTRLVFLMLLVVVIVAIIVSSSRSAIPNRGSGQQGGGNGPIYYAPPPAYDPNSGYQSAGGYGESPYEQCMTTAYTDEDKIACSDLLSYGP